VALEVGERNLMLRRNRRGAFNLRLALEAVGPAPSSHHRDGWRRSLTRASGWPRIGSTQGFGRRETGL